MRDILINIIRYRLGIGMTPSDVAQGMMRTIIETTKLTPTEAQEAFTQATRPLEDLSKMTCDLCGTSHEDNLHSLESASRAFTRRR